MAGDAMMRGGAEAEDISAQLRRGVLHQKWRKKIIHWINYLRRDLKRSNFTEDEDELIIKLHSLLGNKWSLIARRLPGRTDNEIKKFWNTHIRRKLLTRGINLATHRPVTEGSFSKEELRKDEERPVLERCPDLNLDLRISPPHQQQQNQEGFKTGGRESCTLCFAFSLGIQTAKIAAVVMMWVGIAEILESPTSILDAKNSPNFVNPFGLERNLSKPRAPSPEPNSANKTESEAIGLALIDSIIDENLDQNSGKFSHKPINRMALIGSKLNVQIPITKPTYPLSPVESPKSPADFGIKTRNSTS
ncbi:hypothetical protein ACS0TY_011286 [Phlomoides rotata]